MLLEYRNMHIKGILRAEISIIKIAIDFVLNVLPSKIYNIIITKSEKFGLSLDGTLGYLDTNSNIYILRREHNKDDGSWLSTLVHELAHVKQVEEGRFDIKSTVFSNNVDDHAQAWYEVEANFTQLRFRQKHESERLCEDSYFVKTYSNMGIWAGV